MFVCVLPLRDECTSGLRRAREGSALAAHDTAAHSWQ